MTNKRKNAKRKKSNSMRLICWFIVPSVMIVALVADAIGIFHFTSENIIIICICLIIVLLPFLSEIKIKDLSVKMNKTKANK